MKYQRIKGTKDLLAEELMRMEFAKQTARRYFALFGYKEIRTPVLEPTELFIHSTGATTEIVEKQMYTFSDLGGRNLTMRPEGTPGVIRAIVENRLPLPQKLFYIEPMFRQEKPQKGRFREFNQIGIEAIGLDSPLIDAEVISVAAGYIKEVGIRDFTLELNTIGCNECRPKFREALLEFIKPKVTNFCTDCQSRIVRNPLRVYDCKEDKCIKLIEDAPVTVSFLCEQCLAHYNRVKKYLTNYGVKFIENFKLVRGLDYYTRTVFEIKTSTLGAQDSILGGGRYDYLMKELGGEDAPSIGFALGLERLVISAEQGMPVLSTPRSFFIIVMLEAAVVMGIRMQQRIAGLGMVGVFGESKKTLKRQLKDADKLKVDYAIIVGEDELKGSYITLRNMKDGHQERVPLDEFDKKLKLL